MNRWFDWLGLPRRDEAWHRADVQEEMSELEDARTWLEVWSETSDVVFAVARGRWAGHALEFPLGRRRYVAGLLYMFPKYTLRWLFYRVAGRRIDRSVRVAEVRNPRKLEKVREIAVRYGLDADAFESDCRKLLIFWPLLR